MFCLQELWQSCHGDGKALLQHHDHSKWTRLWCWQILQLSTSSIDLIHSERVLSLTSSILAHRLAYASHVSMIIILHFSCHKNETGSLYFGPLRNRYLSISFRTILRSPVTKWPHWALSFVIENFGSNWAGISESWTPPTYIISRNDWLFPKVIWLTCLIDFRETASFKFG